jgi:hypothetical protein
MLGSDLVRFSGCGQVTKGSASQSGATSCCFWIANQTFLNTIIALTFLGLAAWNRSEDAKCKKHRRDPNPASIESSRGLLCPKFIAPPLAETLVRIPDKPKNDTTSTVKL